MTGLSVTGGLSQVDVINRTQNVTPLTAIVSLSPAVWSTISVFCCFCPLQADCFRERSLLKRSLNAMMMYTIGCHSYPAGISRGICQSWKCGQKKCYPCTDLSCVDTVQIPECRANTWLEKQGAYRRKSEHFSMKGKTITTQMTTEKLAKAFLPSSFHRLLFLK